MTFFFHFDACDFETGKEDVLWLQAGDERATLDPSPRATADGASSSEFV